MILGNEPKQSGMFQVGAGQKTSRSIKVMDVHMRPGHRSQGYLIAGPLVLRCALGKGGISSRKREGDGATPLTQMRLLYGYRRRTPVVGHQPATALNFRATQKQDGWCDAANDRNYNRPVAASYQRSHEKMWRKDDLYDVCVVMDWNITERKQGCGSAIFFHLSRETYTPTEGCIALSRRDMMRLLPHLSGETIIRVRRG